jgi:uncharacterized protein with ATP-grasp and redox domains
MKMHKECGLCILRQAAGSPRRFTDDAAVLRRIMSDTEKAVRDFDTDRMPPELGGIFHQILSRRLHLADPYRDDRRRANACAIALLPFLRSRVRISPRPFETAVRLCAAANMIDFGAPGGITDESKLHDLFERAMTAPLRGGGVELVDALAARCARAARVLYICDNAGEIVVDRLLLEQFDSGSVTVAVRFAPVLNDAIEEDALSVGLAGVARIIDTGLSLPGVPLHLAAEPFLEAFRTADVIISKGQGNYETLDEADGPIFFLLCAKCEVVARRLACSIGDMVITCGTTAMTRSAACETIADGRSV